MLPQAGPTTRVGPAGGPSRRIPEVVPYSDGAGRDVAAAGVRPAVPPSGYEDYTDHDSDLRRGLKNYRALSGPAVGASRPIDVYIRPVGELSRGVSDDGPEPKAEEPRRFVERAASAEINGRRVNEAIERGTDAAPGAVFVCECGNLGCTATIELRIDEYEAVRSSFDRFLVLPGHEIDSVEDVVERHDGYIVVVKRDGQAVAMAAVTDDRDQG